MKIKQEIVERLRNNHDFDMYNMKLEAEKNGRKNLEFYQRELALSYVSGKDVIETHLKQALNSFYDENQELKEIEKGRQQEIEGLSRVITELKRRLDD